MFPVIIDSSDGQNYWNNCKLWWLYPLNTLKTEKWTYFSGLKSQQTYLAGDICSSGAQMCSSSRVSCLLAASQLELCCTELQCLVSAWVISANYSLLSPWDVCTETVSGWVIIVSFTTGGLVRKHTSGGRLEAEQLMLIFTEFLLWGLMQRRSLCFLLKLLHNTVLLFIFVFVF